ncbi:subtilase-type protease inhibitor [Nocardia nova]|uniref:subtilase-type protease inhibitor n=1 Tax=Nocardia nova TaxID=37330 RepID=UPI00130D631F|nr:subtilase-type protease inhibitor [Nocardia nova]
MARSIGAVVLASTCLFIAGPAHADDPSTTTPAPATPTVAPSVPDQPGTPAQPPASDQPTLPTQPPVSDQTTPPAQPPVPEQTAPPTQPLVPERPGAPAQPPLSDQPSAPGRPVGPGVAPTVVPPASEDPGVPPDTSALVLAVIEPGAKQTVHSATLECAPKVGGAHPESQRACDELTAVQGDFNRLEGQPGACPMIWKPVTAVAEGYWEGKPVSFRHVFANHCVLEHSGKYVYRF